MNTLIRHIEYLISRKDCVIIPEFGALLATYVSAEYDPMSQAFMPPRRLITFNGDLRHNDGMLVTSLQRAESLSYESAQRRVHAAVDAMQLALAQNGSLTLGAVGTVVRDPDDGTVTFESSDIDNLSVSTLWLEPINIQKEEDEPIVIEAPIVRRQYSPWLRVTRTAAAIALLVGIGFVTTTPIVVDQNTDMRRDTMLASLAPEISQVKPADLVPTAVQTPKAEAPVSQQVVAEAPQVKEIPTYYVIVASFATEREARMFVEQHPETTLHILDKGRYYKVYSSEHTDVYEAYRTSYRADKQFPGAWVYKINDK